MRPFKVAMPEKIEIKGRLALACPQSLARRKTQA
jgi:hypothetical protein